MSHQQLPVQLLELSERSGDVGWISYQANCLVGNELGLVVDTLRLGGISTQPPSIVEQCLIITQKWSTVSVMLRDGFLESGLAELLPPLMQAHSIQVCDATLALCRAPVPCFEQAAPLLEVLRDVIVLDASHLGFTAKRRGERLHKALTAFNDLIMAGKGAIQAIRNELVANDAELLKAVLRNASPSSETISGLHEDNQLAISTRILAAAWNLLGSTTVMNHTDSALFLIGHGLIDQVDEVLGCKPSDFRESITNAAQTLSKLLMKWPQPTIPIVLTKLNASMLPKMIALLQMECQSTEMWGATNSQLQRHILSCISQIASPNDDVNSPQTQPYSHLDPSTIQSLCSTLPPVIDFLDILVEMYWNGLLEGFQNTNAVQCLDLIESLMETCPSACQAALAACEGQDTLDKLQSASSLDDSDDEVLEIAMSIRLGLKKYNQQRVLNSDETSTSNNNNNSSSRSDESSSDNIPVEADEGEGKEFVEEEVKKMEEETMPTDANG